MVDPRHQRVIDEHAAMTLKREALGRLMSAPTFARFEQLERDLMELQYAATKTLMDVLELRILNFKG